MKIYTRTGDDGTTGLIGGKRVDKNHPRVEACGAVDEVNAAIGMALSACREDEVRQVLAPVQSRLFDIGAVLASLGDDAQADARAAWIEELEQTIDRVCRTLPELRNFILPGGTELSSRLHAARVICRRAERVCVSLQRIEKVDEHVIVYLNRLSDLLFTLARRANQLEGVNDIPWKPDA